MSQEELGKRRVALMAFLFHVWVMSSETDPERVAKLRRYLALVREGKGDSEEAERLWRELYGLKIEVVASPWCGAYAVEEDQR